MVGDGPLRAESRAIFVNGGVSELAWLSGERHDVADIMRGLNCFVRPSLAQGASNTILEAMTSGLSVIATDVGRNAELVSHGLTGELVLAEKSEALALSRLGFVGDPALTSRIGRAGRASTEARFSGQSTVAADCGIYARPASFLT